MQRTQNASKAVALASALLLAVALLFSSFATAQQAYAVDASQQVTVQVQGNEDDAVTFTKADLEGLLEEGTLGYQYLKPTGDWFVVGAKDYIELSDLLDEAGVSDYWTPGATLQFTCTDGYYDKYFTTYEETDRANFFYGETGATGAAPTEVKSAVPTVFAFSYAQEQITGGLTAQEVLDDATFVPDTRFCCGLTDEAVNGTGDVNMGKRMPTSIVTITIVPAA